MESDSPRPVKQKIQLIALPGMRDARSPPTTQKASPADESATALTPLFAAVPAGAR